MTMNKRWQQHNGWWYNTWQTDNQGIESGRSTRVDDRQGRTIGEIHKSKRLHVRGTSRFVCSRVTRMISIINIKGLRSRHHARGIKKILGMVRIVNQRAALRAPCLRAWKKSPPVIQYLGKVKALECEAPLRYRTRDLHALFLRLMRAQMAQIINHDQSPDQTWAKLCLRVTWNHVTVTAITPVVTYREPPLIIWKMWLKDEQLGLEFSACGSTAKVRPPPRPLCAAC